jgi:hypothetical protein
VYCSSCCQRSDWDSGHRDECGITIVPTTLVDHRISLRTLAAQASFVEDIFSDKFELLSTLNDAGSLCCLTHIDARILPIKASLVPVDGFRKATPVDRGKIIDAYLAQSATDSRVHVVDAWLPWGGYTVKLLVRLGRIAKDEFRALSWSLIDIR